MRVIVTGAGGFIGSAVAAALVGHGHDVVCIDAFIAQAHGPKTSSDARSTTTPMGGKIEVHRVDLRDAEALAPLLEGIDAVCHQAAMVGAGVAAADLPLFASHNDLATAVLLAEMAVHGVGALVLASSMVVYGDGRYGCEEHGEQRPVPRRLEALEQGNFEMTCPVCSRDLSWIPVPEDAPLLPRSGYAASKVAQEHYASVWARQTRGRVVALRYHNVYGPRMPQDTPYSGVAALFRSALEHGDPPRVFEDGGQMRDFVHVADVARANVLALDRVAAAAHDTFAAYNVCSGRAISIRDVASAVAASVGGLAPVTTGEFRAGDVRHIVASPARAEQELGFVAMVSPEQGLAEFATSPLRARE